MSKMTDEQVMHALRNFPRITEIGGVPCDWLAVNMGATTECLPWAVAFELVRGVLEDQQTQSLALPRGEDRGVLGEVHNERLRQIALGRTAARDDAHSAQQIAYGAIAKVLWVCGSHNVAQSFWPWGGSPEDSRNPFNGTDRNLLIEATAMLVAEIERRDRIMP